MIIYTEAELSRVITIQELQALGFCVRGQRRLWLNNKDLVGDMTFERFIREGGSVCWLLSTGNAFAINAVNRILGKV